jgi:hypothetical protein
MYNLILKILLILLLLVIFHSMDTDLNHGSKKSPVLCSLKISFEIGYGIIHLVCTHSFSIFLHPHPPVRMGRGQFGQKKGQFALYKEKL